MKNKIVLFSNIKGGVGKTTLCALFASYLAEKGIPVFAMDADLQASLYRHRQREKDADPDASAPWAVEMLDTSNGQKLEETISKLKNVPGIVLKAGAKPKSAPVVAPLDSAPIKLTLNCAFVYGPAGEELEFFKILEQK